MCMFFILSFKQPKQPTIQYLLTTHLSVTVVGWGIITKNIYFIYSELNIMHLSGNAIYFLNRWVKYHQYPYY